MSIGIDSEDAAGQSMLMFAGEVAAQYVKGGFDAGKRVSVLRALLGKGHSAVADCVGPTEVVQKALHTTPHRLQRFQKMQNRANELSGGISCTAHVTNGLAAFYIANGQDPARTAESQAAAAHFDVGSRGARGTECKFLEVATLTRA